ncbi:sensor histidine kinase [Halodesulfovibrio marinisediminis]|uniref:histidine kinase n=1 Tax=Halodesulfovibrio marinisediminis DSM 17456 TaxID=1121457 RepID=A0A1N6DF43_9BACT|nr:ATP-binding protein [Halodesulfovibrio marinisediminis]SIN69254.1 PAS domain S-box-containing protein [Halodesulfovibrio marinisediminis DSM 17456]
MKRCQLSVYLFLLGVIWTASVMLPSSLYAQNEPRHILLLNSYHQRMKWVENITRAVIDVLEPEKNNLVIHIENMDTKMVFSREYFLTYKKLLAERYKGISFSIIISSDNYAFDFLRFHRDDLWPNIPVVFCGVADFKPYMLEDVSFFTGIEERPSPRTTVELMLRNHPNIKKIFVINDYLKTGESWRRYIIKELMGLEGRVDIEHNVEEPIGRLRQKLLSLEKDTAVLLGVYFRDSEKQQFFTFEKVGELLTADTPVPVYCLLAFNLRKGVIGGDVISGYYQGEAAAKMAKRILAGTNVNSIPIARTGANKFMFRYPELQRWNIAEDSLPEGSIILDRPVTFFELYRKYIIIVGVLIFVLFIIVLLQMIDIARRRVVEKALRKSRRQFSVLLKNMPGMAYRSVFGSNWLMRFVSDGSKELVEYSPEELLEDGGVSFSSLIVSDDREKARKTINKQLEHSDSFTVEYRLRSSTGEVRHVLERGRYVEEVEEEAEEEAVLEGFITDITDLKNTQAELAALNQELEERVQQRTAELEMSLTNLRNAQQQLVEAEKLASLGGLVAGVAHEINTPLGIGLTSTTYLQERLAKLEEEYKAGSFKRSTLEQFIQVADEGLVAAVTNLRRAASLVQSFKQVAVDQTSEVLREFELYSYLGEVLTSLRPRWKRSSHSVELRAEGDTERTIVKTYPGVIMQIMSNLISNSLVHGFEEMENGVVEIVLKRTNGNICIDYRDNGKGMTPEQRQRVFEPFFTTKMGSGGSGLGMHIVWNLIKHKLNGVIECQSEPGQGARFIITFPISPKPETES